MVRPSNPGGHANCTTRKKESQPFKSLPMSSCDIRCRVVRSTALFLGNPLRRHRSLLSFLGARKFAGSRQWRLRFLLQDKRNESIASARERLHKARLLGIVLQNPTDFADGAVDAVVGVEKDVFAPDPPGNFFAGDELTFLLDQNEQDLQRNALQL
jgi:hypothetical protein